MPLFLPVVGLDHAGEYELLLFIAGASPRADAARRNIQQLCERYLVGRYTLTVVDLQQHPARAMEENILGIPCLVKKRPGLIRRLVGDLADTERVRKLLGIE
jgi:circadian clock protein KaiB